MLAARLAATCLKQSRKILPLPEAGSEGKEVYFQNSNTIGGYNITEHSDAPNEKLFDIHSLVRKYLRTD